VSWPKDAQLRAERKWFWDICDLVAEGCGGSLISGRRTRKRNTGLGRKAHPNSLHLQGLAGDYVFDTPLGYVRAWEMGRKAGLHGYRKPASFGIHWQARPKRRGQ